jgi:acetylornithine deacetylase/succinyl-diaminopimelate desuccinylase-like protein
MIPGFTDATAYARLGAKCYGFSPVRFEAGAPSFSRMYHGDDERIPTDGLRWGLRVLYDAVRGFCGRT